MRPESFRIWFDLKYFIISIEKGPAANYIFFFKESPSILVKVNILLMFFQITITLINLPLNLIGLIARTVYT